MKRLLVVLIAVAFVSGAQAYAHHSFAATYFEDKTAKIEGKLVQFLFRNPHSFVHVEAPDESGQMVRWAVEWGGAGQLGGQGVTRETLKAGDVVTITGNPGRNPATTDYAWSAFVENRMASAGAQNRAKWSIRSF